MRTISFPLCALFALLIAGCDADVAGGALDAGFGDGLTPDASRLDSVARRDGVSDGQRDGAVGDVGSSDAGATDTASGDASVVDAAVLDLTADLGSKADALAPDALAPDVLAPDVLALDVFAPDVFAPDVLAPDVLAADMAPPKPDGPPNTTGLSVPCQNGPGWTLFRFHYGGGGKSAQIDVWDASCSYSFAPNSACNVREVYPGFGSVSYNSLGYPIFTTTQYLRVRFSVAGLSFTKAKVYMQARSYATASSTSFRVWSPLYGQQIGGPVDNDWVYDWYGVDWTGYLYPADKPSLTAIQIYAYQGSAKLAVKALELCVQP